MNIEKARAIYAQYKVHFNDREMQDEVDQCNEVAGKPHMPLTPEGCAHYYAKQYAWEFDREAEADRDFCMSAYGTPDGSAD